MTAGCSRKWEVEAARDGRLHGSALEAHRKHLSSCAECRSEADALRGLAQRFGEVGQGPVDQLAMRRMRRAILEQADRQWAERRPVVRKWRVAALVGLAACVVTLSSLAWLRASRSPGDPQVVVETSAGPAARWERSQDSAAERIRLDDGVLSLRVKREPGSRRVVVEVPDGEIEDLGTVFRVEVSHRKTERVTVAEGLVHVLLNDGVNVTLHAGEEWQRAVPPAASAVAAPAVSGSAADPAPPVSVGHARRPWRAPSVAQPATSQSSAAVAAEPAPAGPDPAREDSAYLRVIALLRAGRQAEARRAAQMYLDEFPSGFRRSEMQQVASGASDAQQSANPGSSSPNPD